MKTKKSILLFSIYILFLFAFFEASARLAFRIPKVSERLKVYDSLSWRRMWVSRHLTSQKDIYYKFDIYDSTKGWISKPNIRNMKVFNNKVLNTNSKGFRGKKEYSYGKNQRKVRILILGDSFTFGDEVSDNETYSWYLQEMMPSAEIINLGVHGYGHDQMLILLKEEGVKYKPDIILLGFVFFDMNRNLLNFRDYAKPKFRLKKNELQLTGVPVPTLEETLKWDWVRLRIVDIISIVHYRFMQVTGCYSTEKEEITTALLREIVNVADIIEALPIFVYLPYAYEVKNGSNSVSGENYLFNMCRTDGRVKYFSARQLFVEKANKGMVFKKGHWGKNGHATVAEAIYRFLSNNGYIPRTNQTLK